jgi:hypothetical protein
MKRRIIGMVSVLLVAVSSIASSTPASAGNLIADNPAVSVGGTGQDFNWGLWQGWWVRSGSTYIDLTFSGIDTGAIAASHVVVNLELGVTNHSDGETGLDGLVDVVVNPGASPTYTLANVLLDNLDPLNQVYLLGAGGTYETHASILVDKNYIQSGTLVIRIARNTDSNTAPACPVGNRPIDMSTQPPTPPSGCYEANDPHRVHVNVRTTDSSGNVAANGEATIWEMTDVVRDNPDVSVGGTGEDFGWSSWQGWWVRSGSTYIDFTFSGIRPGSIAESHVQVIFNLGVTNRKNGDEGLDGLVDFTINPGASAGSTYTVAGELFDNRDHLNLVTALGGGASYETKAVLAVNKYYIQGGTLVIRVARHTDSNAAPACPAGNWPIDMSTDPPTVPGGCYEANDGHRVHINVRTTNSSGNVAASGEVTVYAKDYKAIPTLPRWGWVVLVPLMMVAGITFVHQRRRAAVP